MYLKKINSLCFIAVISILSLKALAQQSTGNNAVIATSNAPLREKIYAHTDKNFYVAGEVLWFKLYDVADGSFQPLYLSNIAYVELLNASQKPVLKATVALQNGAGNGSFYLTSSIASGNYIFRAYTNWMKNLGADVFFQKQITVVNTLTQLTKMPAADSVNYEIGFFPEGGDLVTGIQSKVGVKVTDQYGKGLDCNGNIVDENNRAVASFSTVKFGMGSFYFIPLEDHLYNAVININGRKVTKPLPPAKQTGYVIHVSPVAGDQLSVSVNSTNKSAQTIYIASYNNKSITNVLQVVSNNGNAVFNLNKNNLPAGISQLVVFDMNKQPVCERMLFTKPGSLPLKLAVDKDAFEKRSEVKLNITGSDSANLSMAVYLFDSLQTIDESNILNYLWLTSALKGRIESPAYYFDHTGNEADSALENLLLTQGWSKFKNAQQTVTVFAPEREGHIIEGKVTEKTTGLPAKDIRVYLSIPGKYFRFATDVSNDSGKVVFDIKDFYGSGELVVQTEKKDSMYRVEIADPFYAQAGSITAEAFSLTEASLQQLSRYNLAMQVQNAYSIKQLNTFASPFIDSNAFYGKPDATYYLDNYVRFNTMEEVLREYIVGINVRLRQGNYSLVSIDPRKHAMFENNPLVLIDGVPVFDMNKLIAYNPLKIKRADVLNKKYYINSLIAEGIVSYATYKGDLDGFQFDAGTIELSYDGLQIEREFYSPQYSTTDAKNSRLPDYRNVLYWNPSVSGDGATSFYTSDIKGKYIVIVQGINTNGKAGYATVKFEVK